MKVTFMRHILIVLVCKATKGRIFPLVGPVDETYLEVDLSGQFADALLLADVLAGTDRRTGSRGGLSNVEQLDIQASFGTQAVRGVYPSGHPKPQ